METTKRKVFEDFSGTCHDQRAREEGCLDRYIDCVRKVHVDKKCPDADAEYLRQWLLANGAKESDGYVFVVTPW